MIGKNSDNLKEYDYITLLPNSDYDIKESVESCFNKVYFLENNLTDYYIEDIIKKINSKIKLLIIFDWHPIYTKILSDINHDVKVKSVFRSELSQLTGNVRKIFINIIDNYRDKKINEIACLNEHTYKILKKAGIKTTRLILDIRTQLPIYKSSDTIGIIGNSYDKQHNIYNQLVAVKKANYKEVKIMTFEAETTQLIENIGLKKINARSADEALINNEINLYCNYANTNLELILKSMDLGIPCLISNNLIFNNYSILKKYLVINDPNNIVEIISKINAAKKHKKLIISEYKKFRDEYRKLSKKTILKFLGKKEVDLEITSVRVKNNKLLIKYNISPQLSPFITGKDFEASYDFPLSKIPKSILIIPFLSTILPVIWITDSTIKLKETDSDYYNCLESVKKSFERMYPHVGFLKGKVIATKIIKNKPQKQISSSMFFSGGVDSFSSLISVIKENPLLITIWGSDVFLNDDEGWKTAQENTKEVAQLFNLKNCYLKSNFRQIINEDILNICFKNELNDTWWHGVEHGLALLGHVSIISYEYGIKKHYIPATYSFREKNVTCASYPTIDEKIKYCGCKIIHEGFDKNRQNKLTQICNYCKNNKIKITIRSCYMERHSKINCCKCEKCYRTIMGIIAEGENPRNYGFNISDVEISKIKLNLKTILQTNKKAIWHWQDIQQRSIENKKLIENNKYYKWILTYKFL